MTVVLLGVSVGNAMTAGKQELLVAALYMNVQQQAICQESLWQVPYIHANRSCNTISMTNMR